MFGCAWRERTLTSNNPLYPKLDMTQPLMTGNKLKVWLARDYYLLVFVSRIWFLFKIVDLFTEFNLIGVTEKTNFGKGLKGTTLCSRKKLLPNKLKRVSERQRKRVK